MFVVVGESIVDLVAGARAGRLPRIRAAARRTSHSVSPAAASP
jgi:hypothetical protein